MAFGLVSFEAFGVEVEKPITKRYIQYLVLKTTGLVGDVAYDLAAFVDGSLGTFWDAVDGSQPGDDAITACRNIAPKIETFLGIASNHLLNKSKAAAATTAVYAQTVAANRFPNVTYHTSEGPTADTIVLSWLLKEGQEPENTESAITA